MKTIEELFKKLPKKVREKAVANTDKARLRSTCVSLVEAIYTAFTWVNSPEGHDYWHEVREGLTGRT